MKVILKKKKIGGLITAFIVIMLMFQIALIKNPNDSMILTNQKNPKTSAEIYGSKQWIDNSGFDNSDHWYNDTNTDELSPDLNATINNGVANFEVLGSYGRKEVILNETTYSMWAPFNKSANQLVPNQDYDVGNDGVYCSHNWYDGDPAFPAYDGGDQAPIMYWRTNVSVDVDMSLYEITYASLKATMNASVSQNIDVETDSYARYPSTGQPINQRAVYDYAQFFVEVADTDVTKLNTYELAFNETQTLGAEPDNYYIQGPIQPKNEQAIIDSLTNVFSVDQDHNNFTLILGIYMYCADNYDGYDYDFWDDLRIKDVNLTFSYEKIIHQSTYVSWNQDGNNVSSISPYTVIPNRADLKFQYKIDKNWSVYTPKKNSELNAYLNGKPFSIPIKLIDVSDEEYNWANMRFTSLGSDEGVNLSIEVLIKDDFGLGGTITISIDNVTLDISYTIIAPDPTSSDGGGGGTRIIRGEDYSWLVYTLTAGIIGLLVGLTAYEKHFKFPQMIRKIRKLKKKIRKGRKIKSLMVNSREQIIKENFKAKTNRALESEEVTQPEVVDKLQKGGI